MFGLNPFGWQRLEDIKTDVGDEVHVDGINGGCFKVVHVDELKNMENEGSIVPDGRWKNHNKVWIRDIKWWGVKK